MQYTNAHNYIYRPARITASSPMVSSLINQTRGLCMKTAHLELRSAMTSYDRVRCIRTGGLYPNMLDPLIRTRNVWRGCTTQRWIRWRIHPQVKVLMWTKGKKNRKMKEHTRTHTTKQNKTKQSRAVQQSIQRSRTWYDTTHQERQPLHGTQHSNTTQCVWE